MTTTIPTPPDWTYQPPRRSADFPAQCYYRAERWNHIHASGAFDELAYPRVTLYRNAAAVDARLTLDVDCAEVRAALTQAQLAALRDALNDALADIAAVEAERARQESFDAISAELREADERGDGGCTGVLYAHPDVHYVAPDRVAATVAALDAAGVRRYIVLPVDPAEGSDDARSTRHYPSLEGASEGAPA